MERRQNTRSLSVAKTISRLRDSLLLRACVLKGGEVSVTWNEAASDLRNEDIDSFVRMNDLNHRPGHEHVPPSQAGVAACASSAAWEWAGN